MNREALTKLQKKVEAGGFWHDLPQPASLHADLCWPAFNGSLDAAKKLHEAVLPGWTWSIGQNIHHKNWIAHVTRYDEVTQEADDYGGATKNVPARAWLLAILSALIAEGE